MRKICLTLPTNRACGSMISAISEEAAYAAEQFDVEVHLLILDSSDEHTFATHGNVVSRVRQVPGVIVHHLSEADQRTFLQQVVYRAAIPEPEQILAMMLPDDVSYGACTNRAFLISTILGCQSVHRRDSDSRYQRLDGQLVFPIYHELRSLGKHAIDAAGAVSRTRLDPANLRKPVVLVGSSFVGELSVDIGEIYGLDRDTYYDVVSLWAPHHWSGEQRRRLVDESFRGAGHDSFAHDQSTLTIVDPMRVDMCNISFHHEVYERVPLLPAKNTIGSDYFLMHLVHAAKLPGVFHNRNIVNYYTTERRTDSGFMAYQMAFVKFLLSMLYLNFIYEHMAAAGESLLDDQHRVRAASVAELARESARLKREENIQRLDILGDSYRKLKGRYTKFADLLHSRRPRLLDEAQQDIEDFAQLTTVWERLTQASKAPAVQQLSR